MDKKPIQSSALAVVAATGLAFAAPVSAEGLFVAVKLNHATVDAAGPTEPGVVDSSRTRGAFVLGYQLHNRVEFAIEHWSGSTGLAECRSSTDPCPAIAVPTRGRFTSGTVGYEFAPYSGPFTIGIRGGVEQGRLSFGNQASRSRTSAIAGITGRYYMTDRVSLGLDLSASTFDTRTAGLELRASF